MYYNSSKMVFLFVFTTNSEVLDLWMSYLGSYVVGPGNLADIFWTSSINVVFFEIFNGLLDLGLSLDDCKAFSYFILAASRYFFSIW